MASPSSHPNDPLHGVTLEKILRTMVEGHGWNELAERIPIRCFMFDPTIPSSLTFLRKTPWARKRLEDWYGYDAIRKRSTGEGEKFTDL
jgi:uncharacterized protein (DUF2132 family)